MQITTDISPIVSPKSGHSGSLISPHDNPLSHFPKNKQKIFPKQLDLEEIEKDQESKSPDEDLSHRNNDSCTDESFSMERYNNSDNPEQLGPSSSSNILIIHDNSTERENNEEEDPGAEHVEEMNLIDFEEFVPASNEPKTCPPLGKKEEASPKKESEDDVPKVVSAPRGGTKKKFAFPPLGDEVLQDPPEKKLTPKKEDFNFHQSPASKPNGSSSKKNNGSAFKEESGSKVKDLGTPERKSEDLQRSQDQMNNALARQISELREALVKKDEELNLAKRKYESSVSNMSKDNHQIHRKIEDVSRENQALRQELMRSIQNSKELEMEVSKYREKGENQRDFILKLEEKYVKIENINFSLDKEIKNRELEIKQLQEQTQEFEEKKAKYKNMIKQKDEQIKDLKYQTEENSRNTQNELYVSMIEKTKIYKDKISQLTKQLEDQKEVMKSKDNAVENLLIRMDELSQALSAKNNEISSLKSEITKLNDELDNIRSNKPKQLMSTKHSKNLSATVKEKSESLGPKTRGSLDEVNRTLGHRDDSLPRKSSDTFYFEKFKLHETPKPVFQSYDFNRKPDDDLMKNWGTMNLKETIQNERAERLSEEDNPDNQIVKKNSAKTRSIDFEYKNGKPQSQPKGDENGEPSLNLKELQKRLAYLKNKRLEFERKKYGLGAYREESHERNRDENLSLTQTIPNIKSLIGNIQFSSPVTSAKKHDSMDIWNETMKEKDSMQINNYLQDTQGQQNSLFKSSQSGTNPSIDELTYTKVGSKSKPTRRPPKIDNYVSNTVSSSAKADTTKSAQNSQKQGSNRYNSLSNNSSTSAIKNDSYTAYGKSHKKSLEVNPQARPEILVKNYESPRKILTFNRQEKDGSLDRATMKSKDFKDYLYRGAVTPSGHLHASIMEKLMETKYRK